MKKIFIILFLLIIPILGFCQAHYPLYIYKLDRIYDTTFVKTETTSLTNIITGNKTSIINYNDTLIYWSSIQNKWVKVGGNASSNIDTTNKSTGLTPLWKLDQKVDKVTGKNLSTNDLTNALKVLYDYEIADTTTNNITNLIVLTFSKTKSIHRQDTISGSTIVSISFDTGAKPGSTITYILIGTGNSYTINYGPCKKASGSSEYDDTAGAVNIVMFRLLTGGLIERTIYYLQ